MSVTITLENIPEDIYVRLQEAAQANNRSINSEILFYIEKGLFSTRLTPEELIARARELRIGLNVGAFDPPDIAAAIEQGRP